MEQLYFYIKFPRPPKKLVITLQIRRCKRFLPSFFRKTELIVSVYILEWLTGLPAYSFCFSTIASLILCRLFRTTTGLSPIKLIKQWFFVYEINSRVVWIKVPCSFLGGIFSCSYVPSRETLSGGFCLGGLCLGGPCPEGVSVQGTSLYGPRIRKVGGMHPTGCYIYIPIFWLLKNI